MRTEKQTANLVKCITALEGANDDDFRMDVFVRSCGSPACVLGHLASSAIDQPFILKGEYHHKNLYWKDDRSLVEFRSKRFCDYFGITADQAEELFEICGCGEAQTPQEAIDYIRNFMARNP